jgi:hypothetical protein
VAYSRQTAEAEADSLSVVSTHYLFMVWR